MSNDPRPTPTLRLGISSCLVGEEVRFNGGHKRNDFLIHHLGQWVEWVPVCPEVEIGLGVPRETLRLIGEPKSPLLVAPKSGLDHTESMSGWAKSRMDSLKAEKLDGFVLKKSSPSCGLFRVKVYDQNTVPQPAGRGIFAEVLTRSLPLLPAEEEGRLNDPHLRENFIERIFAHHRWRTMLADPSPAALVRFQATHKMTLMAHSPSGQKELGRLVAEGRRRPLEETLEGYGKLFMEILSKIATPARHANVLHHLMGFLKQSLDADDKAELLEVIDRYRTGELPLVVPITLLKHHLRRHPTPEWLDDQLYLNPYPTELMLRNRI